MRVFLDLPPGVIADETPALVGHAARDQARAGPAAGVLVERVIAVRGELDG
jgi:hypothetical protein